MLLKSTNRLLIAFFSLTTLISASDQTIASKNLKNLIKTKNQLTLYIHPRCPFCIKVQNFMEKNSIFLKTKDIREDRFLQELKQKGGKKQVPCLMIENRPLYESDEIIAYLKKGYVTK